MIFAVFQIEAYLCVAMETKGEKELFQWMENRVDTLVLWTLSDGRAYTAIELANYVEIPAKDIMQYLNRLLQAKIIIAENHRHQYYRLINTETVSEMNALLREQMKGKQRLYEENKWTDLKYCRSCHNHLAGKVGVALTKRLQEKNMLRFHREEEKYIFSLMPKGETFFMAFGIDTNVLRDKDGLFAKACLDFSERLPHLGGKLGVAFLHKMKEKNWIIRDDHSRIHHVTEKRNKALKKNFELDF